VEEYQNKLQEELQKKHDVFDFNKVRRTLIKGLPCHFIELPDCPYLLEQKMMGKRGESIYLKGPDQQSHSSQLSSVQLQEDLEHLNIRAEVWKYVCRLDEIKQREINKVMSKRMDEIATKGSSKIPIIRSDVQLYEYYRTKETPGDTPKHFSRDVQYQLVKDLHRTDVKN
jgi:hypothetical protein